MPPLDTPTLIIVTAIALTLTSVAILISWQINRRISGASHWSLGCVLIAVSVLLRAASSYLHPIFSIGLAIHILVAGFYLAWMGTRIFQGKRSLPLRHFVFMQITLLLVLYLVGIGSGGFAVRTILVSGILGLFSLLIANDLLRSQVPSKLSTTFTGCILILLSIAFIVRGLSIEILLEGGNIITAGTHSKVTYLFGIVFSIAITFGLIIMLNERLEDRLQKLADTDFLTGLNSRRAIVKAGERMILRNSLDKSPTSMVIMDLDNFKIVNDTYSHLAGDATLRHFAKTMRHCFRPNDLLGRLGGEEFIAILANTRLNDAIEAAERLRVTFEKEPTRFNKQMINATVSVGIATAEHGAESFNQLFKDADHSLYQSKNSGRNQVSSTISASRCAIPAINDTPPSI